MRSGKRTSKPNYKTIILNSIKAIAISCIVIVSLLFLFKVSFKDYYITDNEEFVKYNFDFQSELPLIVIDTNGKEIIKEDTIVADMKIYDSRKEYNKLSDEVQLESDILIKIRGNSTSSKPKKQYSVTLIDDNGNNNPKEILDMPVESDWVLNGPYMDKSLIRNHIVYSVSREIMDYAPRTKYCEVFLKTSGEDEELKEEDYIGLYIMIEKIKVDDNRVNLSKPISYLKETSYMILRDAIKDDDILLDTYSQRLKTENGRYTNELICAYPSLENLTQEKLDYITKDVDEFEKRLYSPFFTDSELGYRNYIDIDSFTTYAVINEFFRNVDQGARSAYYYKEIGGKLKAGPVWDYNFSMGNATYSDAWVPEGFELEDMPWFDQLVQDDYFVESFVKKYRELRKTYLSEDYLYKLIDNTVLSLGDAIERNFARWPEVYGENVWPNPNDPATENHEEEIEAMKKFINKRGKWMDENIYEVKSEK
ncbi:CotH kinase family protein [Clostridium sp. 1001275B_160808_H3]|uniref:CotH kinase family protein n=1 Tax=Clostridium sp. 1001275B_160808_H3 TaxID=2787110 RepID=UPI001899FF73|nr:CotH kinase family protein [Clostridium sp. 1001275B_160808_H3]